MKPGNVPGSILQHLLKKTIPFTDDHDKAHHCLVTVLLFCQTFLSGIQVKTGTHIDPVYPAHLVVMPNGRYPD